MTESVVDYSEQPLAVEVDDVTMIFNMASESLTNLKEYFIKLAKHELFFEEFRHLSISRSIFIAAKLSVWLVPMVPVSLRCSRSSPACLSLVRAALRFTVISHH